MKTELLNEFSRTELNYFFFKGKDILLPLDPIVKIIDVSITRKKESRIFKRSLSPLMVTLSII